MPANYPDLQLATPEASTEQTDSEDILRGLSQRPLSLPCKYFYDDVGSALFEEICDLPEYYLTRTEQKLLIDVADDIAGITDAVELVELGSGTARKTHCLIDAMLRHSGQLGYIPVDISEYALAKAAESLTAAFEGVTVRGVLCDYTKTIADLAPNPGCLTLFLGSTIGNFAESDAIAFLRRVRGSLTTGDWFLLGVDLVKSVTVQETAYNDSAGITDAFNKNILTVVNREVNGNFPIDHFEHRAFFNEDESQIEMHLEAMQDVVVTLEDLDLVLELKRGERIQTEISRKFTQPTTRDLLRDGGFELDRWFESDDGYFALALARATDT